MSAKAEIGQALFFFFSGLGGETKLSEQQRHGAASRRGFVNKASLGQHREVGRAGRPWPLTAEEESDSRRLSI